MLLTQGQMSDYKGTALMFDALPPAEAMIADKGYDADWLRQALTARGTTPCIPSKTNRKVPIPHDRVLYRQRHLIENTFGKLKDWRASTPATIAVPTPSSQPSPSPPPSSSGWARNES